MTISVPMYLVLVVTMIEGPEEIVPISVHKINNCRATAQVENLRRGWMKIGYRQLRSVSPRILRFKIECRENIDDL